MFDRVFVANRATAARRVVRACEALGVETVAAYADIDSAAPHLAEATTTARLPGYLATDTYLNGARLIELAREAGCDALHPGYGFLAENASFARDVADAGLGFIGPDPGWIERLGDKTRSRAAMAEAGFPVHSGSDDLDDVEALVDAARRIGFPVLLKPAAGGGGIGMIRVDAETELANAFATARAQAMHAFGDDRVYLETWLAEPRHIEFQVVGDGDATVGVLERECSVQRRHQKVIEEAPAPGLDRTRLAEIEALAATALAGYDSIGTVETLYADGGFGFLEVNTRLQVEHGVTEEVTGVDLVEAQIRIAAGEKLGDVLPAAPEANGHAVEARIYAEDSRRMLPSTGRLTVYRPPRMTGLRVESGYSEGQWVTPYFDPLLAKVIGTGTTREQAIGRTLVGVKAFDIRGIDTNRALLERVLGREPFIAGRLHTGLLDDLL
ncbi:MAG: biotin carboxylase [Gammaproteobacteria bacterium]|nr:biotin carboxylase [Gammaproteobacteria bacterium]MYF27879.1 biotin carboxylase [Gammaproteobacteria bacterium]MYK48574.1 biotin carboxylase [Gammaproteobacteria bacterium]